jgi:hypothetical protein
VATSSAQTRAHEDGGSLDRFVSGAVSVPSGEVTTVSLRSAGLGPGRAKVGPDGGVGFAVHDAGRPVTVRRAVLLVRPM